MSGRAIIFGCFLLSGFSALVYEIIWTRLLMHVFGSTVHAVSTVAAVFMAGLALGSLACGKLLSDNKGLSEKNPLKIYALLEAATGIYGLAVPWLFSASTLQPVWAELGGISQSPELSLVARAVVSVLVLIVPTSLIGATFPALSKAFAKDETNGKVSLELERDLAWLYGLNILGGTAGVLTCAFALIPQAGLSGSTWIASTINLLIAASVLMLANRLQLKRTKAEGTVPGARNPYAGAIPDPPSRRILGFIAAISGFLALFFEVAWTRFFALVMNSSIYSFATVLAMFLVGLAAGAWLVSLFLKYIRQPIITLALFYICSATYTIFCLYLASEMPWFLLWLTKTLSGQPNFFVAILSRVIVVGVNVLIPAVVFGSVLPILFKAATIKTPEESAQKTAWIYSWNTIGAVLGSLACGFLAIPMFSQITPSGLQSTLLLAVAAQVLLAYLLSLWWVRKYMDDRETRLITGGIASIILLAIVADICFFPPSWDKAAMAAGATFFDHEDVAKLDHDSFLYSVGSVPQREGLGTRVASPLLFYRDGLNSTVTVGIDPKRNVTFLKNNGKVEAAVPTDPKMPSEGSDLQTQVMLALLPMLLHAEPSKNVFVVGYGSGTTSGAVLSFPKVEKVTIAEIEQAVIDADKYFNAVNGKALQKTDRVKLIINDARYVLAYDKSRYDVIISQPADPWVAGASELFTVEFWQLAKDRLAKDGIFSQWIQLYSITPEHFAVLCKTFQSVFPNCYLFHAKGAGEVILLGYANDVVSNSIVGKSIPPEVVSYLDSLQVESFNLSEDLKLGPKGVKALWKELADNAPLNTDDNLLIEYGAGKGALTQQHYIEDNIATINRLAAKSELSGVPDQHVSEE